MYRLTRTSNETAELKTGQVPSPVSTAPQAAPGTLQFARSLGNQAVKRWVDQGFTMNSGGPVQRQEPPGLSGQTEEEDVSVTAPTAPASESEGTGSQSPEASPTNSGNKAPERTPVTSSSGPPLPPMPTGSQQETETETSESRSPGALHEQIHSDNETPSDDPGQETPGLMDVLEEGLEE